MFVRMATPARRVDENPRLLRCRRRRPRLLKLLAVCSAPPATARHGCAGKPPAHAPRQSADRLQSERLPVCGLIIPFLRPRSVRLLCVSAGADRAYASARRPARAVHHRLRTRLGLDRLHRMGGTLPSKVTRAKLQRGIDRGAVRHCSTCSASSRHMPCTSSHGRSSPGRVDTVPACRPQCPRLRSAANCGILVFATN